MEIWDFIQAILELGLTVAAPVLFSWVVIRGLRLAGLFLSDAWQKFVVYVASVGSVMLFAPIPAPVFAGDPPVVVAALLAFAGGVMSAAQVIYDKAWKALEGASAKRK